MKPFTDHSRQSEWTRQFIDSVEPGADWPGVEYQWWYNPVSRHSLRLTTVGYRWVKKYTELKFYAVEIQKKIVGRQYLQLERLLTSPYYITKLTQIEVHSETDAVMLQLHAGDLATYLDNLENNQ